MIQSLPAEKESYSIGEVSRVIGVPSHVLRYWERSVGLVRPARRGSGHRRFARRDVETLLRVREMVQNRGFTLAGVKRELRRESKRGAEQIPLALADSSAAIEVLRGVRQDLASLVKELKTRTVSI